MASITVDVSEVMKKLDPAQLNRVMGATIGEAGKLVRNEARRYPAQQSKGPVKWKSEKQRRWFFWALRTGQIQVPYRRGGMRSEKLGDSWTVKTEIGAGRFRAIVGPGASYAPYVQDAGRQAQIHRGNWQTIQESARKMQVPVKRFIEKSLARWAR